VPRPQPFMVLVSGFAGSGKTETGKLLAQLTSWALLDKDTLTRPLVENLLEKLAGNPHDRHTRLYFDRVRPLEYDCLLKTGLENLACGTSAILSAPFIREVNDQAWLRRLDMRCRALGGHLAVVWVYADPESMRHRLIARNAERDAWKIANWPEYLGGIDVDMLPAAEHSYLDNGEDGGLPLLDQVTMLARQLTA
jgi:predicted kinase